jgi:hypothetical protein
VVDRDCCADRCDNTRPSASPEATAADLAATLEVTPLIAGLKLPATQGQGFKFHKLQLQTIRN